ncbi:MAG: glycosyltransferase family 2 protein [Gammaproteobacteria bacterium]
MSTPRVSVIIRCCNEEEHIGRLLSGVLEQTHDNVEVVVVDSGSTDATLAIASRYPVVVRHIRREDFSFGRSLNVGCAAASGEYLLIASAHVYPVYRDWVTKMVAPFSDPEVAVVYGKQRGNELTKFSEHEVFEKLFPDHPAAAPSGYFCNNANCAVRRSQWQEHPYDENLTGLEDLAWARARVQEGYRVVYQHEASVIHVHQERWSQVLNRYRREAIALRRIAPEERFGVVDFLRCFAGNAWSDARHAAAAGDLRHELPGILAFRLMQFWGTYLGQRDTATPSEDLKHTFYYPKRARPPVSHGPDAERRAELRIPYATLGDGDDDALPPGNET